MEKPPEYSSKYMKASLQTKRVFPYIHFKWLDVQETIYRLYTYHIAMVLKQLFTLPAAEDISEFTLHISAWSFGPNTTNQATMRLAVLVMWSQ